MKNMAQWALMAALAAVPAVFSSGRAVAAAEADPAPVLGGRRIVKLDWNIRELSSGYIDDDALPDLAVINNDTARITFLLTGGEPAQAGRSEDGGDWEPVFSQSRFRESSLITGFSLYSMALGDLDGDGLTDVAYTAKQEPLSVRFREAGGGWSPPSLYRDLKPLSATGTCQIVDIDADGSPELAVAGEEALRLFQIGKDRELGQPGLLRLDSPMTASIQFADADGDGRRDLLYVSRQAENALRVHFQDEDGTFGPAFTFQLQLGAGELTLIEKPGGSLAFAYIESRTGLVQVRKLEKKKREDGMRALSPRVLTIAHDEAPDTAYAIADFDGDGRKDMVASRGEAAQIAFYKGLPGGRFRGAVTYPSLEGVSSPAAADFDGNGRAELLQLSNDEDLLGISRWLEEGRLSFPRVIALPGRLTGALAAGELNKDGAPAGVAIVESSRREEQLVRLEWEESDTTGRLAAGEGVPLQVPNSRGTYAMRLLDLNNDGRRDVIGFVERGAARLYLQGEDGSFTLTGEDSALQQSLLEGLSPDRLSSGDLDKDGRRELLIAQKGYISTARLGEDGALEVIDQVNARSGEDALHLPTLLSDGGNGPHRLLVYESEAGEFQLLEAGEDGVYRFSDAVRAGGIRPVEAPVSLQGEGSPLLLLGGRQVWILPFGYGGWQLNPLASYDPEEPERTFTAIACGELNGTGGPEFLLVDGHDHYLEVVSLEDPHGGTEDFSALLEFQVFETNPHYTGRKGAPIEPREVLVRDLTGDGRDDIALITHDRVLLYPQE